MPSFPLICFEIAQSFHNSLHQADLAAASVKLEQLQQEHGAKVQSLTSEHEAARMVLQQSLQKLQVKWQNCAPVISIRDFVFKLAVFLRRVQSSAEAADKRVTSLSSELKQLQVIIQQLVSCHCDTILFCQEHKASGDNAATRRVTELTASLETAQKALADHQALLQQQQREAHELQMCRDQENQQQKHEMQQIEIARSAAESRVQLLLARETQLQQQLLQVDRQASESSSQFQEQVRLANSAQVAAEGQVQTLSLRNTQLELQLQRHIEALSSASEKIERTVSDCDSRLLHAQNQHAQTNQEQQLQIHQLQTALSAATGRVDMLAKHIEQLQAELLQVDRQASESSSQFQEQVRQANSAQVAAEGQVQTLSLRNKQLELQLQRQVAAVSESRAHAEALEAQVTEFNRVYGEAQQQLLSYSAELVELREKAAELRVVAERKQLLHLPCSQQRSVTIPCRRKRVEGVVAVERV